MFRCGISFQKWLFVFCVIMILSILGFRNSLKDLWKLNELNPILLVNTTYICETKTTSPPIHPMFKDAEANLCYSLRSLVMPEEMIDLNAIAVDRRRLEISQSPKEVTFGQVHSILYGDPSTKLIYSNAKKFFNKTFDSSYPHTSLTRDLFISIIDKIDSRLKLQFVVEVGSFTGNSASNMGSVLQEKYPGSFLFCIDTWLGGKLTLSMKYV